MGDRYTAKDARACFERLAALYGRGTECWVKDATGRNRAQVGAWELDCNHVYGGFVVNEMHNEGGGVSCPFGDMRRSARDFCEMVWTAEKAVRQWERRGE